MRAAAERPAREHPAFETGVRERVAELAGFELALRRSELRGRLSATSRPSPNRDRLAVLESRIAKCEGRLADLDSAHDALAERRRPDRRLLARLESERRLATRQLGRLEVERPNLEAEIEHERDREAGRQPGERLELALIEERLEQVCRREVAAERLQPSPLITAALGERPTDPAAVDLWNEGVQEIHSYRRRHALSSTGIPLGRQPRSHALHREWQLAGARLARIQAALGVEQTPMGERSLAPEL